MQVRFTRGSFVGGTHSGDKIRWIRQLREDFHGLSLKDAKTVSDALFGSNGDIVVDLTSMVGDTLHSISSRLRLIGSPASKLAIKDISGLTAKGILSRALYDLLEIEDYKTAKQVITILEKQQPKVGFIPYC